jgi:DNA-binding transcriptional MerR regulator
MVTRGKPAKRTRARSPSRSEPAGDGLDLGSDKLYFKIGEVADIVGVPAYVLRYWESEFAAIKPQKSRAQQRVYRRRDVATLLKIKHLLYDKKFTIAGARQMLRDDAGACEMAAPSQAYLARQSLARVRLLVAETRALVELDDDGRAAADPAAYLRRSGGARGLLGATSPAGGSIVVARPEREPRPR